MKLALVMTKNTMDLDKNIKQMEVAARKNEDCDLLLFGEGYLQGHGSLSFDYEKDIRGASGLFSEEVIKLRRIARDNSIALGFGFYENDKGGIYNSYLIIGKNGETLFKHQGLTSSWQKEGACADYRQGYSLGSFTLENKRFSLLLADDFFNEAYLLWLCELDASVDAFLWIANKEDFRFKEQSQILAKPIYYHAGDKAYFLKQGKIINSSNEKEELIIEVN